MEIAYFRQGCQMHAPHPIPKFWEHPALESRSGFLEPPNHSSQNCPPSVLICSTNWIRFRWKRPAVNNKDGLLQRSKKEEKHSDLFIVKTLTLTRVCIIFHAWLVNNRKRTFPPRGFRNNQSALPFYCLTNQHVC